MFDESFAFPSELRERARMGGDLGQVAVIGAGVAGLVAAYELQQRGYDVVVYEGASQPGGRVRTYRFWDGTHAELGAMRIPDNHHCVLHYVQEFGLGFTPSSTPTRPLTTICGGGGFGFSTHITSFPILNCEAPRRSLLFCFSTAFCGLYGKRWTSGSSAACCKVSGMIRLSADSCRYHCGSLRTNTCQKTPGTSWDTPQVWFTTSSPLCWRSSSTTSACSTPARWNWLTGWIPWCARSWGDCSRARSSCPPTSEKSF